MHGTRAILSRSAIGAGKVNLNALLPPHLVPEKSDAAVLAWFWLFAWRSPCLVPFRGKGDDDSRADEPELHTGVAAADQPVPRGWAVLWRGTFSGSIVLTDV